MKYSSYILFLLLIFTSCKKGINNEFNISVPESNKKITQTQETELINLTQTNSISELWNNLVFEKGGCLVGAQYITEYKGAKEGAVFNNNNWIAFFNKPKTETTKFLITKFSDTTKTKIHTCPFFGATSGEIAVYSLQQIHNKNWYDFLEFNNYSNRETTNATDQPQMWLRKILKSKTDREKLMELFLNELKK